jgi:hypothetical protein
LSWDDRGGGGLVNDNFIEEIFLNFRGIPGFFKSVVLKFFQGKNNLKKFS